MSSSGCQMSTRPPPKPKVLKPMDSRATLPVRIIRSAQEILLPYFFLIGQSRRRALSRLQLSGQLLTGAKRWFPVPPPPRPPPPRGRTARLVRVAMVGPAIDRRKTLVSGAAPPAPVTGAVGAGAVPGHANEQAAV